MDDETFRRRLIERVNRDRRENELDRIMDVSNAEPEIVDLGNLGDNFENENRERNPIDELIRHTEPYRDGGHAIEPIDEPVHSPDYCGIAGLEMGQNRPLRLEFDRERTPIHNYYTIAGRRIASGTFDADYQGNPNELTEEQAEAHHIVRDEAERRHNAGHHGRHDDMVDAHGIAMEQAEAHARRRLWEEQRHHLLHAPYHHHENERCTVPKPDKVVMSCKVEKACLIKR